MVYRIRPRGLRIKPAGLFCKEMVYRIRSRGLRIKPIRLVLQGNDLSYPLTRIANEFLEVHQNFKKCTR